MRFQTLFMQVRRNVQLQGINCSCHINCNKNCKCALSSFFSVDRVSPIGSKILFSGFSNWGKLIWNISPCLIVDFLLIEEFGFGFTIDRIWIPSTTSLYPKREWHVNLSYHVHPPRSILIQSDSDWWLMSSRRQQPHNSKTIPTMSIIINFSNPIPLLFTLSTHWLIQISIDDPKNKNVHQNQFLKPNSSSLFTLPTHQLIRISIPRPQK